MLIIHIAEANSDQIVEIRGENLRSMLCAYWTRNRWHGASTPYNFVSTGTNGYMTSITFIDETETLTITKAPYMENVYYADWDFHPDPMEKHRTEYTIHNSIGNKTIRIVGHSLQDALRRNLITMTPTMQVIAIKEFVR